jgi:Tfp pilus assembly protein PilF
MHKLLSIQIANTAALAVLANSSAPAKPPVISSNTRQTEILTERAASSNLIDKSEGALSLCNAALSQDSNYAPAYTARAEANISLGKPNAALVDLTKASQSAPFRTKIRHD